MTRLDRALAAFDGMNPEEITLAIDALMERVNQAGWVLTKDGWRVSLRKATTA